MRAPPAAVRALVRATPTIVRLQNRALISVSGSQAAEFLNGLLSTAVTTQQHASSYSSFLHAQVSSVGSIHPLSLNLFSV
jgi:folate-binding Fe-S cluster repair protein YgfZ